MYIIKNAFRCICRSKGRNVLIGVIVLVIAVSACLGLSIRQAAENARKSALESMSVTATISFDRSNMMAQMKEKSGEEPSQEAEFERSQFSAMMESNSSLTLEEYEKYAKAESVDGFYYNMTASFNGNGIEPVSSEETEQSDSETTSETAEGSRPTNGFSGKESMGGKNRVMGVQSDFTVVGYSGEDAMTDFVKGTAAVTEGNVFNQSTQEYECIITEELATFNNISVGNSIKLANPNNEDEIYQLKVVGLYSDSTANESSFSEMGATVNDPANKIYMSYNALEEILNASEGVSTTETDENTGREYETKLTGNLLATYVFNDVEGYTDFEQEVRDMGLEENYTVSSSDITAFENSLVPLETLSTMAGYFLLVILGIGAVILVVLNIFNVRERKYEIGVLTAMGMKKGKVALQLLTEIFAVTIAAVIIGVGVGAVCSVPVTNTLLAGQIESAQTQNDRLEQNFGRGQNEKLQIADDTKETVSPDKGQFGDRFAGMFGKQAANYITEVNSAMNLTVVAEMLGIAVLLTLISGLASMLFVMRYEPLKILANRD